MGYLSEYKILDIRGINESEFGETVLVKANPYMDNYGNISVITHECSDTRYYIIPVSQVNDLVAIAQSDISWKPKFSDFVKQFMRNGDTGKYQTIYRHISFYRNKINMKYVVNEVTSGQAGNFRVFAKENWMFTDSQLLTPYGNINFKSLLFVDNPNQVGIQFTTSGIFRFDELPVSINQGSKFVKTLAIARMPHNAWLWIYMFDENDQPLASFCGRDDLDGFSNYIDKLKHKYSTEEEEDLPF